MPVLRDSYCKICGSVFIDVWSDDHPTCCGSVTAWRVSPPKTDEWGAPRSYPHIREEPFSSRSELAAYARSHGMRLGESNEKVGGARNEEHLHLGKLYSYARQGRR